MKELEKFQCANGGFAYWPGAVPVDVAYLTSYLLHVFKVARDLKYDVDQPMQQRAYDLPAIASWRCRRRVNESWWPAYTAWQAFAVKVLVEGGRNEDSQHHAPLRLPRSDAGLRAGLPARRAGGQGRESGARDRRAAAADDATRC